MPGPCPYALALSRVPRRKWATRAELLERVELTRKLIEQAPSKDLTIASLAKIACLSESHFIRLFRDTYGHSPRKMLSNHRMALAKNLLTVGKDLNDIVFEIGYSSVPTFCRRFRELTGQTPTQYRLRQNESAKVV